MIGSQEIRALGKNPSVEYFTVLKLLAKGVLIFLCESPVGKVMTTHFTDEETNSQERSKTLLRPNTAPNYFKFRTGFMTKGKPFLIFRSYFYYLQNKKAGL